MAWRLCLRSRATIFALGCEPVEGDAVRWCCLGFDPWQMEGRTVAEIEAAVEIAEQYGSYAMAHSYKRESILRALNAGVKSIEHGFMYDCEIGKLMKKKGAYITTNLTALPRGSSTFRRSGTCPPACARRSRRKRPSWTTSTT